MDQPTVPTGLVDLVHPRVVRAVVDTDLVQDLPRVARAVVDTDLDLGQDHPRVVRAPRVDMDLAQDHPRVERAVEVPTTCSPRPLVDRDLPRVVRPQVEVGTDTEEIYEASKMKSKSNWNNKFLLSSFHLFIDE